MDESTSDVLEAVGKSVNLTNGASCNSAKRKLLVLDVNGLLVSICSYVPYDYDPDDIILRKAGSALKSLMWASKTPPSLATVENKHKPLLLKKLKKQQYTAVFPDTYHFRRMSDYSLGPGGDLRVYLEGLAIQEYVKRNPFGQRPITQRNLSWLYYLRVIEASTTIDDES